MKKTISILGFSIFFAFNTLAQVACDTVFSFPLRDTWPTGIAWDGRQLWTSGSNTDYIYKYMANGQLLDSILSPSPATQYGLASLLFIGPRLWAISEEQDILYEIDTVDGSAITQIQLPANTNNWGLAYNGSDFFLSSYLDGILSKIDTSSGQLFGEIVLPKSVLEIKFINGALFGLSRQYDYLYRIDENTGQFLDSIAWCVPYPLGVTWDGDYLWNISSAIIYGGNQKAYKVDLGTFLNANENRVESGVERFEIFPNPVAGRGTIAFESKERGLLQVDLFDGFGQKLRTILRDETAIGKQQISFDVTTEPAGIYVVRVLLGGRVASAKLVVAR